MGKAYNLLEPVVNQERVMNYLSGLVSAFDKSQVNQTTPFEELIVMNAFNQFKALALAHRVEAIRLKNQTRGKSSFSFLKEFVKIEKHSQIMMKKLINNSIIQEAFTACLIKQEIINQEALRNREYLCDMILVNLLEQIWVHQFVVPSLDDLVYSLNFEVLAAHSYDKIEEDLFAKRFTFSKIFSYLERLYNNQRYKETFSQIVDPSLQIDIT